LSYRNIFFLRNFYEFIETIPFLEEKRSWSIFFFLLAKGYEMTKTCPREGYERIESIF